MKSVAHYHPFGTLAHGRVLMSMRIGALIALAVGLLQHLAPAEELTEAEFQRLHEMLRPADDEPWLTIPWKVALLDAQRAAAQQERPIFIWAMDGHPLGCT